MSLNVSASSFEFHNSKMLDLRNHNLMLIQFYVKGEARVVSDSEMIGISQTGNLVRAFIDLDRVDSTIKEKVKSFHNKQKSEVDLKGIFTINSSKGKIDIAFNSK